MKTYRWEVRCLAFFFAVAEANAYSAYKVYAHDGKETLHTNFRWRLAQSLLSKVEAMRAVPEEPRELPRRTRRTRIPHKRVSLGNARSGYARKRRCHFEHCSKKSTQRCVCGTDNVFCKEHMDVHFNTSTD